MLATTLLAALMAAAPGPQIDVPRVEDPEVRIDGVLSEEVWGQARVLSDFTQFEPVEGAPASERTEVRIFYSPSALYVGVRAYARDPGRIRATLAERDAIQKDDHVQILLDTFLDRRRAYALYVNPLGIQQDGIYSEGARDPVDFNPNFLYDSRGRVTETGYEVEIRIPLKSLKFPSSSPQSWGINITRHIAATGAIETWAPLSRDNPQRLAQSGTLRGLEELRPGTLLELNPVATGKRLGSREADGFRRGDFEPDVGLNLKYGVTSNLTLDATVNPDFSQIEADAGQIATNERFALFFPEKRPFFLEGAEIFRTPEPLVYTRAIVDPIAGAKLTGKIGRTSVGYLGALDESPLQIGSPFVPRAERAAFHLGRLQRDVGDGSSVGLLVTDREAGEEYNRVAGLDARLRFADLYVWEVQAARAWTREWRPSDEGVDTVAHDGRQVAVAPLSRQGHLLQTAIDRTGRHWGFRLQMKDIPEDFVAGSGFLRRTGVTDFFLFNRLTFYGAPGALVESWGPFLMANRIYDQSAFWSGGEASEGGARLRLNANLRGNHRVTLGYGREFIVLDPARYARYRYVPAEGDTLSAEGAVRPLREMDGLQGVWLESSSSYFKSLSARAQVGWKETPIFAEGSRGEAWSAELELGFRPTDALRIDGELRRERIARADDGTFYSRATLQRLKVEYQVNRAIFLRATGQYLVETVDLLRAPGGTPLLWNDAPVRLRDRRRVAADLPQQNPLRVDLLFSYQPSPGTMVFLGYGREMTDDGAYRFSPIEPRADGLFVKVSYLFRS